jgi:hypothetical protein
MLVHEMIHCLGFASSYSYTTLPGEDLKSRTPRIACELVIVAAEWWAHMVHGATLYLEGFKIFHYKKFLKAHSNLKILLSHKEEEERREGTNTFQSGSCVRKSQS